MMHNAMYTTRLRFTWLGILILILINCTIGSCNETIKNNNLCLYRVQVNGLYGFIDSMGNTVIAPQYKYASSFTDDGFALVIVSMKKLRTNLAKIQYGVINKDGDLVEDTTHFFIDIIHDSLIYQFNNRELNFNVQIEEKLEPKESLLYIQDTTHLMSKIGIGMGLDVGKYGYKKIGQDIIAIKETGYIEDYWGFHSGHIIAARYPKNPFIIYDREGNQKEILDCYFHGLWGNRITQLYGGGFYKGKAWLQSHSHIDGYITGKQRMFEWILLDTSMLVSEHLITADENWGLMYCGMGLTLRMHRNKEYLELLNEEGTCLDSIRDCTVGSEKLVGVLKENVGGWQLYDSCLHVISQMKFEKIGPCREGMIPIMIQNKWGCIDTTLKQIIPCIYSELGNFHNGLAYFKNLTDTSITRGYINQEGKTIWSVVTPIIKKPLCLPPEWHGFAAQTWMEKVYPHTFVYLNWLLAGYKDKINSIEYVHKLDSLKLLAELPISYEFEKIIVPHSLSREMEKWSTRPHYVYSIDQTITDSQELSLLLKAYCYFKIIKDNYYKEEEQQDKVSMRNRKGHR